MGWAAPPRPRCPAGATAYTGTGAGQASVAALVSPRDPTPSGGQEHYTAQEAFTLDGGSLHPPHTCNLWVPRLKPAPLGPDTVPSWLGGPEPVSGNRAQGRCRKEGKYRGEGLASAVTGSFDGALLLWALPRGLVPGHPPHPPPWGPSGARTLGAFLPPRPGLRPQPRDPMKPNKLPKLSPQAQPLTFLEVPGGSNPSHKPGDFVLSAQGAFGLNLGWDQGHWPQSGVPGPSSASLAPTRAGLPRLLTSLGGPFLPFRGSP